MLHVTFWFVLGLGTIFGVQINRLSLQTPAFNIGLIKFIFMLCGSPCDIVLVAN